MPTTSQPPTRASICCRHYPKNKTGIRRLKPGCRSKPVWQWQRRPPERPSIKVGGWHVTRAETRWGCFLPDLTRLARGSSTANLPAPYRHKTTVRSKKKRPDPIPSRQFAGKTPSPRLHSTPGHCSLKCDPASSAFIAVKFRQVSDFIPFFLPGVNPRNHYRQE